MKLFFKDDRLPSHVDAFNFIIFLLRKNHLTKFLDGLRTKRFCDQDTDALSFLKETQG